jgi:serine/threonine-protein kinase
VATPSADLSGALLVRRYRLGRRLGEGGMGIVHEADDTLEGQLRAAKILRPEYVHNAPIAQRFVDEARTCQRLAHPNVTRVFDVQIAEDGTPFFVMELLEGATLGAYIQGGARIPLAQAAPVVFGVLAGLAAAHAAGIVHRDLKPENVFLARDGGGGVTAKILDFGIAKVMDVAGGMGSRTQTGMILGTPAYMSPEQIRNSKDVDARSDLFAAGVLFYEMLAGRPAFTAENEFAKLTAVLTTEPEPIERVAPELASLSPFFARALAKDRDRRFQSAEEMAGALSHALAGAARTSTLQRMPQGLSGAPPPQAGVASPHVSPSPSPAPAPAALKNATLASAPSAPVHEHIPEVLLDTPGASRRSVPAWVAAVLVVTALFFGFVLGFGVARAM